MPFEVAEIRERAERLKSGIALERFQVRAGDGYRIGDPPVAHDAIADVTEFLAPVRRYAVSPYL